MSVIKSRICFFTYASYLSIIFVKCYCWRSNDCGGDLYLGLLLLLLLLLSSLLLLLLLLYPLTPYYTLIFYTLFTLVLCLYCLFRLLLFALISLIPSTDLNNLLFYFNLKNDSFTSSICNSPVFHNILSIHILFSYFL